MLSFNKIEGPIFQLLDGTFYQGIDAHHIIENTFVGPQERWNHIHPAKYPNEHQASIHVKIYYGERVGDEKRFRVGIC
ncbi:hypothetical protein GJU40_11890 [Bacillus lacus]|uniref:Uncharacterized protein n=1 Tax=Metabacillus lacus TaxID=1983721 RepID=A0A7X2LYY0_9BACI|nr:hypothetical protein [Metabacillus lacus]